MFSIYVEKITIISR